MFAPPPDWSIQWLLVNLGPNWLIRMTDGYIWFIIYYHMNQLSWKPIAQFSPSLSWMMMKMCNIFNINYMTTNNMEYTIDRDDSKKTTINLKARLIWSAESNEHHSEAPLLFIIIVSSYHAEDGFFLRLDCIINGLIVTTLGNILLIQLTQLESRPSSSPISHRKNKSHSIQQTVAPKLQKHTHNTTITTTIFCNKGLPHPILRLSILVDSN